MIGRKTNGWRRVVAQMYEELHIMTPVVPTRELSFLRYCKQIEQGLWAVADVSLDGQRDFHYGMPSRSRRMPSGCLIADMSNGYSKVIDAHAPVQAVLHVHVHCPVLHYTTMVGAPDLT
jgi:homeobox-leucine zipper protein